MNVFGYSYIVFLGVYLVLFFIAGFATYLFVKEIDMPEPGEISYCEEARTAVFILKDFVTRQRSNWLLMCDFAFQENAFIVINLWLPLYLI